MKIIKTFEDFRLYEELSDEEAQDKLKDAFKSSSPTEFMDKFREIASDKKVQSILKAGKTDGDKEDEIIKYEERTIDVKDLVPTQSEIGFDQSVENILTDQYGSLESILQGDAKVGGPIVTYNGKYVIDGHHRWSQVFAANPDAKMDAINLIGDLKPQAILVAVQAAIAATLGDVPSADPKGINILKGVTEDQVADAVKAKLTDKAREIWQKYDYKDDSSITKEIFDNLEDIIKNHKPIPGAPGRKDMPQTDAGEKGSDDAKVITKLDKLKYGRINFKDPKKDDPKDDDDDDDNNESLIMSFDSFIFETEDNENLYLLDLIMKYVKDPDEAEKYAYDTDPDNWPDWLSANMDRDPDYKKMQDDLLK